MAEKTIRVRFGRKWTRVLFAGSETYPEGFEGDLPEMAADEAIRAKVAERVEAEKPAKAAPKPAK